MQSRRLRAGLVNARYEAGSLREICLGATEILRQVYFAVRDDQWHTIQARIEEEEIVESAGGFQITSVARYQGGDIDYLCRSTIRADGNGEIQWTADGEAQSTFRKNRIGYCVLHPIAGCAGHRCTVEHTDGSVEQGLFPALVSPHQPFGDIRSITHTVVPGIVAVVKLDGDVFEMEDHRNWTDQSFKTYSTPLAWPYPATVHVGERLRQAVTMQLRVEEPPRVEIRVDRNTAYQTPAISIARYVSGFSNFAELNRNRGVVDGAEYVEWAINPKVHATDEATMFENLEGQWETAKTCATFAGGRPMHVSPVLTPEVSNPSAWIAGSIAQLARGGIVSIQFDREDPWLDGFVKSKARCIFHTTTTDARRAIALAAKTGQGLTVWVANLMDREQVIEIEGESQSLAAHELRSISLE